jgi:hypothetical protein
METSTTPDTPTYKLVAEKLGRDPVEFIRERRNQQPPVPYAKIADEIKTRTKVYVTHEIPRRWLALADQAAAEAAAQAEKAA